MQVQRQESEEASAVVPSLQHQAGRDAADATTEDGDTLRVTPEEVALAAAALEAKRDAEHTWREKTLPLEEAIQHLGLNATPQELAPEVVALRAERSERAAKNRREQFNRQIGNAARMGVALAVLLIIAEGLWSSHLRSQHLAHTVPSAMTTLPIQKLAVIADNVPVHIDADTLLKLATGNVTPEDVSVDTRAANSDGAQSATMFNNEWTLVKSNGELLIKGWATAEFALNISNNSTGALFSTPPVWIPANNLVPIQVPVYRLENQLFARYAQDGKVVESGANSVLMEANVADTSTAAKDLVKQDILSSDGNFAVYADQNKSNVYVGVKGSVVELTGTATDAAMKKLAGDIAAGTLQRLHLPFTVSNKLDLAQKDK